MAGITETQEVLVALGDAGVLLGGAFKAVGKDPKGIAAFIGNQLMQNPALMDDFHAAFAGIREVPAELKDLNFVEGASLAKTALEQVTKVVGALA